MKQITKEQILDTISSMSLLEVIELIDAMEKKFGINNTNININNNINNDNIIKKEEKNEFDLYLNSIGKNKISVIKIIRSFLNIGLKESKDLVDSCPVLIKDKINKKDLDILKKSLEEAGAIIEIK